MRMWKSGNQTTKKLRCQQLDLQVSPRLVPTCRLKGYSSWVMDQQIQWTFWPVVTSGITPKKSPKCNDLTLLLRKLDFRQVLRQNHTKYPEHSRFWVEKNIEMLWYYTSRNFGEKSPQCVCPGICGAPLAMCAPGCIEFHEPSATLDVVIKVELGQLHDIVLESDVPRSGATKGCELGWVGNKKDNPFERIVGNDRSTNTKVTMQSNHPISTLCISQTILISTSRVKQTSSSPAPTTTTTTSTINKNIPKWLSDPTCDN